MSDEKVERIVRIGTVVVGDTEAKKGDKVKLPKSDAEELDRQRITAPVPKAGKTVEAPEKSPLDNLKVDELKAMAKERNVSIAADATKAQIIAAIETAAKGQQGGLV